jgi:hypothetical protein
MEFTADCALTPRMTEVFQLTLCYQEKKKVYEIIMIFSGSSLPFSRFEPTE